jgi:hypothetical protein
MREKLKDNGYTMVELIIVCHNSGNVGNGISHSGFHKNIAGEFFYATF